jgi:hypothetical protein
MKEAKDLTCIDHIIVQSEPVIFVDTPLPISGIDAKRFKAILKEQIEFNAFNSSKKGPSENWVLLFDFIGIFKYK